MINIAKRLENVKPSLTRKLFNMAKEYDDVIDLTLGDPDLPTPEEIKNAGEIAISDNKSHYSANAGLIEARIAVKDNIKKHWNIDVNPNSEIILTVGGMEGLYLSLLSIINDGDEVILFSPYYVNYYQMVYSCNGKPVIINSYDSKHGLHINKQQLEKSITTRTKAIIINSPNNPTGGVFSKNDLKIILDIAIKHDLLIISDEVYHTLLFDDLKHESILQFENAKGRTVLIDSLSKEFCMTGWRIGYVYAPDILIEAMTKMQENIAACAPLISQYALIEAYTNNINTEYILGEFQSRRDYIYDRIAKIKKVKCIKPKGTFYIFIDISDLNIDSFRFACNLLQKKHVAVVPGTAYGDSFDKYIRIAFTRSINDLKMAMDLFEEYINEL